MQQADEGIDKLRNEVDTLIIVPNEKLLQIVERRTTILEAFRRPTTSCARASRASPT